MTAPDARAGAFVRAYRPADTERLVEICVRTADAGSDATGLLEDDRLWADLFLLPYLARQPDLAFVLDDGSGVPMGYIVGTDDTDGFEDWFREEWWAARAGRWPLPSSFESRQNQMLGYGWSRRAGQLLCVSDYPAHLHIDLLPEAQGGGWGRVLIDTLCNALLARKVPGVHAEVAVDNPGALVFYSRTGFQVVASRPGSQVFGRRLASQDGEALDSSGQDKRHGRHGD